MGLNNFYNQNDDLVHFSRQQASRFAKEIADDFNPLHDVDAKMFCVPGDLLFSVSLHRLGLSQRMRFTFSGMVTDDAVVFPDSDASRIDISDAAGKCYLTIERDGKITRDKALIEQLVSDYVAFSGKTFPHLLVPLMSDQGVMINPARPLAIYQHMEIQLKQLELTRPILESAGASMEVAGKKGLVRFDFVITENGRTVGNGCKHMSLRGLQPYDEETMTKLIETYKSYRDEYHLNSNKTD